MSIIYQPKGKAREYSPLAANLYLGCNHGCKYCYAPSIRFQTREQFKTPIIRRNILLELEKDCKKYFNSDNQVLLCFMSDPYNKLEFEYSITRDALKLFLKYKIPISILTKAGHKINRDFDIIKKFGNHIQIGTTLTMDNDIDSKEWEPEAALPEERIEMLSQLKYDNIKTWASFEPVIDPKQSLNMIKRSLKYVDIYKIGKINNYKGIDKTIDWNDFLSKVVELLRSNNKPFYIKKDLRESAKEIKLYGNEVLMDEFNIIPFENGKTTE
jgi:DNA repair photolyase